MGMNAKFFFNLPSIIYPGVDHARQTDVIDT